MRVFDAAPVALFDRMYAAKNPSMEAEVRMEQFVLEMTPAEARTRMFTLTPQDPERLKERLAYRAAAEDPAGLLSSIGGKQYIENASLMGLYRAWVRKDPETALKLTVEKGENRFLFSCVSAWAECNPVACAKAVAKWSSGTPWLNAETGWVRELTKAWVALEPSSMESWLAGLPDAPWCQAAAQAHRVEGYLRENQTTREKAEAVRDGVVNEVWRQRVWANPVAGFQAVVAAKWGRPYSADAADSGIPWNRPDDWIANAFASLVSCSPELAAQSLAALPVERLSTAGSTMVSMLERVSPGAGLRIARAWPEGELRDAALESCAPHAAEMGDIAAAKEAVNGITNEAKRSAAIAGVLNFWTSHDPYGAREWLVELEQTLPVASFAYVAETFVKNVRRSAPGLAGPWGDKVSP